MTDSPSRLWEPLASEDALAGIFAYDDSETRVPARQGGGAAKVVAVVVVVAVVLLLLVVLVCAGGESCVAWV